MSKINGKTFKAVVNVNFSTSIIAYNEIKLLITDKMKELEDIDPTGAKRKPPTTLAYQAFAIGDILTFGDDIEYVNTDNQFKITVYPRRLFDEQSSRFVDLPCKMKGNVVANFNRMWNLLPPEEQKSMEKKYDSLTARYHRTPVLSMV